MPQVTLKINGTEHALDVPPNMPLLWALRDKLNITGTKYSCGIGLCGACTVLADGVPLRSCQAPAASMAGREITTIEGLSGQYGRPGNHHDRGTFPGCQPPGPESLER